MTFVSSLLLAAVLAAPASLPADVCRQVPADAPGPLPCEALAGPLPAPSRAGLRIATFNVHFGRDVERLAQAIAANPGTRDADILLLQEIESYPHDRRAERLARRLGHHMVYAPARPKGEGTHGLAILSRYPLRDMEVIALPRFELGWGTRRRVALAATVEWAGAEVRIVDVHLDTRLTTDQRFRQIRPVLERTAQADRVVIGGDVNTISCLSALLPGVPIALPGLSQGPAFDTFMRRHGYLTPFRRIGWTGPLRQRLDGIFVRGLDVTGFDKEDGVKVSDHVPLWADLRPPDGGAGTLVTLPLAAFPGRPTF